VARAPAQSRIPSCGVEGPFDVSITVTRDTTRKMKHVVQVRQHHLDVDEPESDGGEDLGPDPHDLYDSALAACKAMTVLWYAKRKGIPLEDLQVGVEHDACLERHGVWTLRVTLTLGGLISKDQRQQLLGVARRCPVHKLMTEVKTEIETELGS
jgi:putative redox protein